MTRWSAVLVQMHLQPDKAENLERARALIREAVERYRPQCVALPENFLFFGTPEQVVEAAEPLDGPAISRLREDARTLQTTLLATLKVRDAQGVRNSTLVIGEDGAIRARYDKIHVFTAQVGERSFQAVEEGGTSPVVVEVGECRLGLSICYDVRFPELYRALVLMGAEVLMVPALFTFETGRDHWLTLLRARAIENQCYVLAPAIWGSYPPHGDRANGRSLAIDPWGVVIAQASDGDGLLPVQVDLEHLRRIRQRMPVLRQRRPEAYHLVTGR